MAFRRNHARLAPGADVRLVVDALDCLATGSRGSVMDALNELGELPFLPLVVTARPDTELPQAVSVYALAPAANEKVSHYLERRGSRNARKAERAEAFFWRSAG